MCCEQDIELCAVAIRHAGKTLSPCVNFVLTLLGGVRRWLFLPTLLVAVPTLARIKGGDALSVCLNTVGTLFLCDIDNIVYSVGLSERARTCVEEFGRVELGDVEAAHLVRSKGVHMVLIVVILFVATVQGDFLDEDVFLACAFIAFWLSGVIVAATAPGTGVAEKFTGVVKATGSALLGYAMFRIVQDVNQTFDDMTGDNDADTNEEPDDDQ